MSRTTEHLSQLLTQRIAIIDGAMGTMVQTYGLGEDDFRGDRFRNHGQALAGCNDVLVLTQPQIIKAIHQQFLAAGADIIETNTFSAQTISLSDYGLEAHVYDINRSAARVAREAADQIARETSRPRFVAGSIGPTTRTASMSPDVNDPGFRAVTFDQLVSAYQEQALGLLDGGVDLLLPETNIDTLNLKAALFAIEQVFAQRSTRVPVITSFTITDNSGRTLAGQTVEAAWVSVAHARPLAVALNCALGPAQMRPYIEEIARVSDTLVACYPNAGLPNEFGGYDESPQAMAAVIRDFAQQGWLNIAGGCCGTTPEHIRAIAEALRDCTPRRPAPREPLTQLSGLETLTIRPDSNFLMIGERTNITGSRRFARLIKQKKYEAAVEVARKQVEGGANVIDVNMDEALLDSEQEMTHFLNLVAAEPDIARVPVMIDSSKWSVLEAGLKCLQGKGIVNSISLKEGEDVFRQQATLIRRYGAAVVVMAFDEDGQATDTTRRLAIVERSHRILTKDVGFPEQDLIFDPNILTVGTGIEEHNDYAVSFLQATREIKKRFPRVKVSGGVSNISFSFRGNDVVREAMHAVFLYHAIKAGLDMAIVNAGQLALYDELPTDLRDYVEDVLLNRRPDATERLIGFAETVGKKKKEDVKDEAWRSEPVAARLAHALIHGITDHLETDLAEASQVYERPLHIIEGPLLDGMSIVGDRFGAGKMFLPQVVKSARAMKKAVAILQPAMEAERAAAGDAARQQPKIVMATVKGDVHDIGKNIVGVVLRCNDYEVIDLGVMVPADKILDAVEANQAQMLGLSGLITPSLEEMVHVAKEMTRRGHSIPLLIGGATTSRKHTAVKIAPQYEGFTVQVPDASRAVGVAGALISETQRPTFEQQTEQEYGKLRERFAQGERAKLLPYAEAVARRPNINWDESHVHRPEFMGVRVLSKFDLAEISEYIDWTPFFHTWELRGVYPAILEDAKTGAVARELLDNGRKILDQIIARELLTASGVYGFFAANSIGDDLAIYVDESREIEVARLHTLRQQRERRDSNARTALADFVAPVDSGLEDFVGLFAVTAGIGTNELSEHYERQHDDYHAIMVKALADRLAEAFAELLHQRVRQQWGYGRSETFSKRELIQEKYQGIRPAPGYPACPDHTEKRTIFDLLGAERAAGITLTDSYAMLPAASVSGIYLAHPRSHYFAVGPIGRDQVQAYAKRKGISIEEAERWLAPNLGYQP